MLKNVENIATLIIGEGQNVTLDLNGKNISSAIRSDNTLKHYYAIDNYGTLTINDSSEAGTGTITARGIENLENGYMTINGGKLIACDSNGGASIWNEADLTVNGGTFETTYPGTASDQYGAGCLNNSGKTCIKGGVFKSVNKRTYAIISTGEIEITPAEGKTVEVTGAHGGLGVDSGTAVINGGKYASSEYYGLYVSNDGKGTVPEMAAVTVNGGSFDGANYSVWIGSDYNNPVNSTIEINGGEFKKPLNAQDCTRDGAIVVTGGTFSTDPSKFVAAGYIATKQSNETWTVAETHKEAAIGNKRYETLDSAISEASSGDTVKLLDNVDYSTAKCFDIDKTIILDLNGKEITAVANGSCSDGGATHFIRVKDGGDLTITDSSAEKDGCITATYGAYSSLLIVEVMSGGKFTFTGGKIKNAADTNYGSTTVYVREGGAFSLDGGTVAAVKPTAKKRAYAVWNVGKMKMTSGLITSDDSLTAAVTQDAAKPETEDEITMEITGGEIDAANKTVISVSYKKALPVISGGQFSGALNVKWLADEVYGINGDTGSTVVNAAPETFNACINQKLFYTGETGADDAVIAMTNGDTLTLKKTPGEVKTKQSFTAGKFTVEVENGAAFNPAAISVAAGYTVEATTINENTTEYNIVVDKEKAQAKIGDIYYTTLANANANAKNGDTITVLKDVTGFTSSISVSKKLTIDLNGHLVQGAKKATSLAPNGSIIRAYSDETKLVIVDSSEAKSGKIENTAASGCAVFADKGTVEIKGGALIGKDAAVVASDTAALTVSGGYFLDESAEQYLATSKTLVESDKSEYTYMVVDKKEITEGDVTVKPAKPAVGDVVVDENTPTEIKDAIAKATVSEKAFNAALKREINTDVTVGEDAVADAKNKLNSDDITIFAQAFLNIKVANEKDFAGGENAKCVLDITPMYQLVATTAGSTDPINIGTNAVVIGEPQELKVNTAVEVTIPLPDGFTAKADNTVTIKHTKSSGAVYYYTADVTTVDGKTVATFTNLNGFSTFEVLKYSDNTELEKINLEYGEGESVGTELEDGQLECTIKFDAVKNAEETLSAIVAPTKSDENANIKVLVGGREVEGDRVDLALGINTFNVLVLAEDNTAALYTVDAVRCELVDDVSLSEETFTYNGKAQVPAVTVKTAAGDTLENGANYTVSYEGNGVSVGTHTVTVLCKGQYEGEVSKTYTIKPGTPSIKKIKASKRKMTVYMTTKPSSKGAKSYRIYYKQKGASSWEYTTTSSSYKTINGLKKGKRYYVKVEAYTGSDVSESSKTKLSTTIR